MTTTTDGTGRPPNVLFVLFDKCRRDAVGAYGERDVCTPHLDAMARAGVRFDTCYTPQSLCGPARASILTGLHPHAHGLDKNVYPHTEWEGHPSVFPEPIPAPFADPRFRLWDNFPFYLHNAGYRTAHVGKWHLGMGNPGFFDRWCAFNSGLPHWVGTPHASPYRPDVHTDLGVEFIADSCTRGDRPFFLYQSYYAPHDPIDPPRRYLAGFGPRDPAVDPTPLGYDAAVSNLDDNVGRLLQALDDGGVADDTLVVVTADHGRPWGTSRRGTGAGGQLSVPYDEVARVPLVLRWPAGLPAGAVHRAGVCLTDLMPTLLDAAGVHGRGAKSAVTQSFDTTDNPAARSLLADLRAGHDLWRRPVILQNAAMTAIDGSLARDRTVRTKGWKLILRRFDVGEHPVDLRRELYDMDADPGEATNLASDPAHGHVVRDLTVQLLQWALAHGDALGANLAHDTLRDLEAPR